MAITAHEDGSTTPTIDAESTLNASGPETTDGLFSCKLDVNALDDNGSTLFDRVWLRMYEKVQNGSGTQRLIWQACRRGRQVDKIFESPAFILLHGWDWKILQDDVTARAFPWQITKLATASEHSSGSQTCTLDTEHTLTGAETTASLIQVYLDLAALTLGDIGTLRIYGKVRSADTKRVLYEKAFSALSGVSLVTPLLLVEHDWDVSIEQADGTGRAIPWSIRKLG